MAETVKKSRIVSDDDLEESLMQEFNIRLKHCMSQEQVQEPSDDEEDKEENVKETIKMEFNNVTTNGNQDDNIYDEVCPVNSSERFLYEERSVYYETNGGIPLKNGLSQEVHDKIREQEESLLNLGGDAPEKTAVVEANVEVIYDEVKNVKPILQLPTTCLTDMSDSVEQDSQEIKSSVKDRMLLSTDDTSCLLFTQTVTSPMLTPSEENIDFLKGFQRQSSQNTTSTSENTNSENVAISKNDDVGDQQNEDATESSNISDKLDAEYENVAQINATEGDVSEVDNLVVNNKETEIAEENFDKIHNENIYELIEEDADDKQEEIYENMEILRKQSIEHLTDEQRSTKDFLEREILEEDKFRGEDNIYENIEDTEEEDIELSNAESIEEIQRDIPDVPIEETSFIIDRRTIEIADEIQPDQTVKNGSVEEEEEEEHRLIIDSDMDDKSIDNPSKMVDAIKNKFLTGTVAAVDVVKTTVIEQSELSQLKAVDIMKQIHKFENKNEAKDEVIVGGEDENNSSSTEMTESSSTYLETTTTTFETSSSSMQDKSLKKKKSKKSRSHDKENISVNETNSDTNMQEVNYYNVNVKNLCRSFGDLTKIDDEKQPKEKPIRDRTSSLDHARACEILKMVDNVFGEVSVKALKSSFNKFDALQKKNVLHVRSSDSSTAQEKFNGAAPIDNTNCKACGKVVFQMEQIKAEKSVWHKNCFRCQECSKQLTVDTYQSNEGTVYCKPHFKSLFAPKVVEDEAPPSDKPDLGLEELQSLNVRERFQVFEHHEEQQNANSIERGQVNVKRSPSILSKLAKFQSKGMDVGVTDDSLNGIPIEESSSEEEPEEEEVEGEDADLIRAKKAQKEKPFHFTGMSDVKSKWEHGEQNSKDVRREERKQEIQSIRDRLFMGKQGKMKEAYQQAVMESESCTNLRKAMSPPPAEVCDTRSLKEKFEKGEAYEEHKRDSKDAEDMSVFESGISKKSRSIFLELDANASKAPQISPVSPPKVGGEVKKVREAESPEREVYRDPEIVRAEEQVEDSIIAKETHTATKVLNKFRQMEENMNREPLNLGPKPLKRFTPPPEPARQESSSEGEASGSEEESGSLEEFDQNKGQDADLLEAQKAARARQLRAKFEKWEAKEIKREQQQVNIIEELGEDQAQIESTKALRARFESLKDSQSQVKAAPKVKVNRFVETTSIVEVCYACKERVYPLEKISIHEQTYHKKCFKCKECNTVLRMDSYTYNQGLLYCIPHFKRLFISKGNYDTAFGLEQHKEKWNTTVA